MGLQSYQTGPVHYVYCARSDIGPVRQNNEDSLIEAPDLGLFGVCDGLGGHVAGEIASRIAATTLRELLQATPEAGEKELRNAILEANDRILQDQEQNPDHQGMGTTVSSLWLERGSSPMVWIGHVGDSRIYQQERQELKQLTEDHSPVFRLYKQGLLTKGQMRQHPQKNLLERSLGVLAYVEVDVFTVPLKVGDCFLICSDGLTDVLSDEEIQDVLARRAVDEAVDELIARANNQGGSDNVSVVILDVVRIEDP